MTGQTTTQPANAADNAAVNAAYNHVHNLLPVLNDLYFDADTHPAAGSRLQAAKQDADEYVAHSLAGILFQSAEDHLILSTEILPHIAVPRYALYTAIRAAIEAAAWCQWLEALPLSKPERIGRALTERVTSIRELDKLGRAGQYAQQIQQMRSVAQNHGLAEIKGKKTDPDPVAFGQPRPTMTNVLHHVLPEASATPGMTQGEHTYKTLSARAHGTGWALVEGAVPVGKFDQHTTLAYITVDIPELLRLLKIAIDMQLQCVRQRLELAGRDPLEIATRTAGLPPYTPPP